MNSLSNKKVLNIFTLCVLIFSPLLFFISLNLEAFGVFTSYDSINPAIPIFIAIPFLIYIYISDLRKRKLDIFDYLFLLIFIFGILSCMFSINKMISIFGKSFRHEGFLTIIGYYLLFMNWKTNGTEKDIRLYKSIIIIIGVLNSIFAFLQIYSNFSFIIRFVDFRMAFGLCGNPNFLGTLMVMLLSIVMFDFLTNKICKNSFANLFFFIVFFITLINAASTGPLLTFAFVLIFLIVFAFKKKIMIKKNLFLILIIIPLIYSITVFANYKFTGNKLPELGKKSVYNTIATGGSGRLEIWYNSLQIVKQRQLFGIGYDNLYLKYAPNYSGKQKSYKITKNGDLQELDYATSICDNAHNVYLQILVDSGLFGCVLNLLVLFLVFLNGIKLKNKLYLSLFLGFVGYSIQAFANINVVYITPIYYVIMGLIISKQNSNKCIDSVLK